VLVSDFTPWLDLTHGTASFGHLGGALAGGLSALWVPGADLTPQSPKGG